MTDSLIGSPERVAQPGGFPAASPAPRPALATPARTLLDVFAATVAQAPEQIALDAPDGVMAYRDLADAAHRLAGRLGDAGIGPGDRVGVCVPSGSAELYVAILGVLHAGAAYVPVDADDPPARAETVWDGAQVVAVVREGLEIHHRLESGPGSGSGARPGSEAGSRLGPGSRSVRELTPEDDAWIIFTSGSTGAPKGVAVSHRSAAAFVDAETELWNVGGEDRVLAGLSVGFDASCEEMWLAWRHGAALVPAPRSLVRAAADLGPWLAERNVTVISTVPTLAAMWREADMAAVRLLILGGEACPDALAWRLVRGREVWNTYGPTEATVVSTAQRVESGRRVTIGWPLRGWEVAIVDERGEPVALGDPGELVIAGVGLGRYLDPALDASAFAALPSLGWRRAYRTGDIVRETIDGLQFIGRRDDQVKLGGRRLELGEVEAHLSAVPGVRAAAAAVQKTAAGNPVLVAYVVSEVEPERLRDAVADRLPDGIVPLIVTLDALPTTTSGKVDRRALPWPPPVALVEQGAELSSTEAWLADRWAEQLGTRPASPDSDFFALGGSSLAAAKLISVLRERYPSVAVTDVYEHRRLGELAGRLDALGEAGACDADAVEAPPWWFGMGQLAGVLALMAVGAVPWLLGTLAYGDLVSLGTPRVGWPWLILGWVLLASPPAHIGMYVAARWALLGDLRPGRHPRYGGLALRLWFIERLSKVTHLERLGGTPWVDRYARLIGADVGPGARLGTVPPATALLHVGAGATIEANVDLHGWWIDGGSLVVGEIEIGAGAYVGSRSLLNPGTVLGEGAEIEPGSVVGGPVPAGQHWGGAPARYLGPAGEHWPAGRPTEARHRRFWRSMFAVGLSFEGVLGLLSLVPALAADRWLGATLPTLHTPVGSIVLEAAVFVIVWVPSLALLVALTLRVVWKLIRPGWHPDDGAVAWALWFGDDLKTTAGTVLFPLYASLFTAPWLRLMGIRVGERAEVSIATGLNPLVSLGALSQATDDVGFCTARARGGALYVEPISVGARTFLGPGAVLRAGTSLGDDSLLGVMTLAPLRPAPSTSWFGVPPLELPRVADRVDARRATNPPLRLVLGRGAMELLRLFGPNTLSLLLGVGDVLALVWLLRGLGLLPAVALAPLVLLVSGVLATVLTVALKWLVIGRYRASEHPLWSFFVWRDELMNTVQEQLAAESLLEMALGTPALPWFMRAMGSRVGRGVWFETLNVTEFDMVQIEDGCAINRDACVMTHLFHDRLLRIGPTLLGPGATLGPRAAVLPETRIGAGTSLAASSVVLRGEELPAGTRWQGAPVRSA